MKICPAILGLFTGIPMFEVRSKLDHSKFGSFVGSIKLGSVRSKFGKDEVQTALELRIHIQGIFLV